LTDLQDLVTFNVVETVNDKAVVFLPWNTIEPEAQQQILNTASMPFVFKHVAVMPDCHYGKGATVGTVLATQGAAKAARDRTWIRVVLLAPASSLATSATIAAGVGGPSNHNDFTFVNVKMQRALRPGRGLHKLRPLPRDPLRHWPEAARSRTEMLRSRRKISSLYRARS
jgi:hypothetical protein